MKRLAFGLIAITITLAGLGSTAQADRPASGTTQIQLLTVSDWHGQIVPLATTPPVGGAAVLEAYFDQARAANPNTLTFMAGDSFGATPPISSFFDDEPAIRAMNMMGISADTLGNHNFDGGIAHLQDLVDLAEFPFVSANLKNLEENVTGVSKRTLFTVDGVRIAVIGITNEEAPTLVTPGAMGTIQVTNSVAAANKAAQQARVAGAEVVVILTHKGIRGHDATGTAFGELVDFANGVDPALIDVIVGDHTDFQYSGLHNGILAVENLSKGATFANIQLTVDRQTGVTAKSVSFHVPVASEVTPDPGIQAYIDDLNAQLAPILGEVIGESTVEVLRSDACGQSAGRICESRVGNLVTDAMRTTYGTDFALTNSGGLRAALTCPAAGSSAFCPTGTTTPPFPITRGGVIGVLPFGNESTTVSITGDELRAFLENGVSAMPGANGKFPQVSGLCFTYDISAPVGSRVTSMVRQAADGSCTGPAIDPATTYSITINDFIAAGGDGYPNVLARSTSRNLMASDVDSYVAANSPLNPAIQGRIVCTSSGAVACPTITAP
jgi:2',3'-cyclic-nucleotide 2'-phosphodiesterase (5'-nucleotidase family)